MDSPPEQVIFEIKIDIQFIVILMATAILLLIAVTLAIIAFILWYFNCFILEEMDEDSTSEISVVSPTDEDEKCREKLFEISEMPSTTKNRSKTKAGTGTSPNFKKSKSVRFGSVYKSPQETRSSFKRATTSNVGRHGIRGCRGSILSKRSGKHVMESDAVCAVRLGRMKDRQGNLTKWEQWLVKGMLEIEDEGDNKYFEAHGQISGNVSLPKQLGPGVWTVFGVKNNFSG